MTQHTAPDTAAQRLRAAIDQASAGLVDRAALVELIVLSAVAREHLLVIGPPGTAKSEAVRRLARAIDARTFEYLLGRFTEPSEIFGPVDLRKLRDGVVHTDTSGMLPEAELAFLDEVFLGSTAILNTLLGVLNERVFRRGHTRVDCPLRICIGASNALPDDPGLSAFADRFLIRVFVDAVADPLLEDLLAGGWRLSTEAATGPVATLADLDALAQVARAMDPTPIQGALAQSVRRLRGSGLWLSDRRVVKAQRLATAAAALAGRAAPTRADLWPLIHVMPTAEDQATARAVLRDLLTESENDALATAAAEASQGALAHSARLVNTARALLDAPPAPEAPHEVTDAWRLKLEGIAREIDAGFAPEHLPPNLAATRAALVEVLGLNAEGDAS